MLARDVISNASTIHYEPDLSTAKIDRKLPIIKYKDPLHKIDSSLVENDAQIPILPGEIKV